jgi:hypothetical protein
MHVYVHVCVCVCMYVCMYVHVCVHACRDDIFAVPPDSCAQEVIPVFIQIHIDGVQISREFKFRPTTMLHINVTIYNIGEKLRRTVACRLRVGLVCANKYARKLVDHSIRRRRLHLTRSQRAAKMSRKSAYLQRLLYKRIAAECKKWYQGIDYIDTHSTPNKAYRVRVICFHSLFDLPAISEATGVVS